MAVVNLTLITNAGAKRDVVNDSMTLKEIYEKFGVDYGSCSNTVDSVPLQIGDLNKSLRELGCGSSVRMSSIVKQDCAAKLIIVGGAAVVKSAYKLDQWKKAMKYNDIGLYDDNDEPVFKAFIDEGPGSLSESGVVFSEIPDAEGYAIATLIVDPTVEDKLALVKEKQGLALLRLKELESGLEEEIQAAEGYDQEIDDMITAM